TTYSNNDRKSLVLQQMVEILNTTLSKIFFFSSRRRHTRSKRDWSSDVCSSDLIPKAIGIIKYGSYFFLIPKYKKKHANKIMIPRSEERRVGKECRSRWWKYHEKKKKKKDEKVIKRRETKKKRLKKDERH